MVAKIGSWKDNNLQITMWYLYEKKLNTTIDFLWEKYI